jgi:high-affinity Fe2+/Pb2+ permease
VEHVWDLTGFLSGEALPGQLLRALFGYNPKPSLVELISYLLYFAIIGTGLWLTKQRSRVQAQAQA